MAWNPETYNKFKSERFAPFYDLLELVDKRPGLDVIDLGCGTGELTRKLADALPDSRITGVDSSGEMLREAEAFKGQHLRFEQISIENALDRPEQWDLVFSNAAIQWVEDHPLLFCKIVRKMKPGGQMVIQMPSQHQNVSTRLLNELADEPPYRSALHGWNRISPVLNIEQYAQLLFESGGKMLTVFEKVYPMVLPDPEALFEWVSGTALIPFTEKLEGTLQEQFKSDYQMVLEREFPKSPVFYPFKRIILSAKF